MSTTRSSSAKGPTAVRGSEAGKAPKRRKPGRVPTACAECRRLKLRCNRQVPCEKCESRGCGAICPDGVLTPGKGNRLVLASTEELHDRIDSMSSRMRLLESALRDLQASASTEPHPLLRDGLSLLSSGKPTPTPPPPAPPTHDVELGSLEQQPSQPSVPVASGSRQTLDHQPMQIDEQTDEAETCGGTLISTPNGGYLHLGSTARPEYLMRIPSQVRPKLNISSTSRLSKRIINTSFFDSDLQEVDDDLAQEIYSFLPPIAEAEALCQVYLEHGKYLYTPLSSAEVAEVLTPVYRAGLGSFEELASFESLSLLFIIFALGASLNRPPDPSRAQEYFYLSRASLSLSPPRCGITLVYIQAIIYMAQYLDLSNPGLSHSTSVWLYAGYAARLGQDIALQLDNAHWELHPDISLRRCRTFWRLFVLDTWTSFYYGRPLVLSPSFIDCPFPKDIPTEHATMSFDLWNSRFASLVHSVITVAFGPKRVPYSCIIELDRRIRDFHVPTIWVYQTSSEKNETSLELHMQRYFVCARKEIVLLSLHRSYLVQLLSEKPVALEGHRYRASAAACYRSAWRLIHVTKLTNQREVDRTSRISLFWSHCLSAIVVMSLLVTNDPKGPIAFPALRDLEVGVELFENAAPSSQPAMNLLFPVRKLLQTAREAAGQLSIAKVGEQELDPYPPRELERLAGKTTRPHDMTSPWPLYGPPAQRTGSSTSEPWQTLAAVEEDPFQVLKEMAVQQHLQPQSSHVQPQVMRHGMDCMHTTLEQDLRDLDLGSFGTNMKGLTDSPSIKPHSTSPYAVQVASTGSAAVNDGQDAGRTPSEDSSSSTLSERSFPSSDFVFGMEFGQGEQHLCSASAGGPGALSGLIGGNALLMLDPSLNTIAEHLGFFSTPLAYSSPWFTSLPY